MGNNKLIKWAVLGVSFGFGSLVGVCLLGMLLQTPDQRDPITKRKLVPPSGWQSFGSPGES